MSLRFHRTRTRQTYTGVDDLLNLLNAGEVFSNLQTIYTEGVCVLLSNILLADVAVLYFHKEFDELFR